MNGLHLAVDGSGLAREQAGVGVYTREILHAMSVDRPDCRFTVYLPAGVRAPGAEPRIGYRPLPSVPFVGRHVQWPARIRRLKPNAYFGPAGTLPLGRVGCSAVITVHDLAIYRHPEWFPGRQPLSTRLVVPRSLDRADVVIAVSNTTAQDIEDMFGIPPSRIDVVPHGVSSRYRPLGSEDLATARAKLRLPERFILFVGTIEPRKNLATLLQAWAMLRNRPDLVIVGAWGWRYEEIKEQMGRLGDKVHHVEGLAPAELPAVYNLARALAHPAWYEGFGLPPLEAMAHGTPVLTSNTSSIPEVVGNAAVMVNPENVFEMMRALERVLLDQALREKMRQRGYEQVKKFSWNNSAEAIIAAYEQVAGVRSSTTAEQRRVANS